MNGVPATLALVITQIFTRNVRFGFQPAKSGDSPPEWSALRAEPWDHWRKITQPAKAGDRVWSTYLPRAIAHFVGLLIPFDAYLGFAPRFTPGFMLSSAFAD